MRHAPARSASRGLTMKEQLIELKRLTEAKLDLILELLGNVRCLEIDAELNAGETNSQ
jgi:hypothetical protein